MVHNSIARYELPSLHTVIEMLSGKVNKCCGQGLGRVLLLNQPHPNSAAINQIVQTIR